jgi:hypothetical protein
LIEIPQDDFADAHTETLSAISAKVPIIFQAALDAGQFAGFADFLILDSYWNSSRDKRGNVTLCQPHTTPIPPLSRLMPNRLSGQSHAFLTFPSLARTTAKQPRSEPAH